MDTKIAQEKQPEPIRIKEYVIMAKIDALGNFSYHLPEEVDKACLLMGILNAKVNAGLVEIFKVKEPPKPKIDLVSGIRQNYKKVFGGK